jgi:2-pyrone-4,6-dicarboxylate lactonase
MSKAVAADRPHFVAPSGACDSHCHVFGPDDRFPFVPGRDYYPPPAPKEAVFALHSALGLSRGVIVQGAEYGFDNSIVLDALAAAPDRYRGIAVMDPHAGDDDIERLHRGGMRGIRLSLVHGADRDPAALRRIAARIRPFGWHIEMHMEPEDVAVFADVIAGLPLAVVIDHMARIPPAGGVAHPAFPVLLDLLRHDNAWVKISGVERATPPPHLAVVPMAQALLAAAPDRVVWGSNYPHPKVDYRPDDAGLLGLVSLIAPNEADQKRLLVDNPARLYDFPAHR